MAGVASPRAVRLRLDLDAIACWRVDLEQRDTVVAALASVLSPDERDRAARFVFPRDRRRFTVTRACLRVLLSRARGVPASAIRFAYGPQGKPALDGDAGGAVHFSVSHAEECALIAMAPDRPLGVDVEAVRPMPDLADIAARYFTDAEARTIAAAAPAERELAFFLCWTRKEAFSKALGDGLSFALDRYQVACAPGAPARVLAIDGSAERAAEWSLLDLRPAPGFVGAIAMRAAPREVALCGLDVDNEVLPGLL